MAEVIDAYTHWMSEDTFTTIEEEVGFRGLSGIPSFLWDIEKRKSDMAAFGVDRQVVTLAYPTVFLGMDQENALTITKQANDDVRRLADDNPDYFIPVGTIPYTSQPFLEEFQRCVEDLDMAGVQMFTHVDGKPLDDESFVPFFERAQAWDAPVWIHPQDWNWHEWTSEYLEHRLFGWPFETTLALSRLVYNGIMEEFPELKVIAHHAGGMIPFYGKRIEAMSDLRTSYPENYPEYNERVAELSHHPVHYFEKFYVDTAVSGSRPALETTLSFFGSEQVVFSTDYPFSVDRGRRTLERTIETIDALDIDTASRRDIYGGNVEAIVQ